MVTKYYTALVTSYHGNSPVSHPFMTATPTHISVLFFNWCAMKLHCLKVTKSSIKFTENLGGHHSSLLTQMFTVLRGALGLVQAKQYMGIIVNDPS